MYTIGEFSRISGISIKALRLYHEKGLLIPSTVDENTGYRYYNHKNFEKAQIIKYLKEMEFSLSDIKELIKIDDESDIVCFFEIKLQEIEKRVSKQKEIIKNLKIIINREKEAIMTLDASEFKVEEKELDIILIAGIRFKGKYSDCGKAFAKIAKTMGRFISGKPFNLYYDSEFKDENADIESCFPVKKSKDIEGISARELPGGKSVSLIHKGPYENLGRSYEKIMSYIKENNYQPKIPSREIYIKGPGMIFKGRPENYLTEIQILIDRNL